MAAKHGANAESSKAAGAPKALGMPVVAVVVVIALVVGVLLGHFVLGGSGLSAAFAGKTSVAEGDLDQVIAIYTYKGKTESVTVRDAIESQTSLDAVKDDDGNYTLPNADSVLAVARNKILEQVAVTRASRSPTTSCRATPSRSWASPTSRRSPRSTACPRTRPRRSSVRAR